MNRLTLLLSAFGLILGLAFGLIFLWMMASPTTTLAYVFFEKPSGARLIEIENSTARGVFGILMPALGAVTGCLLGIATKIRRWTLVRAN